MRIAFCLGVRGVAYLIGLRVLAMLFVEGVELRLLHLFHQALVLLVGHIAVEIVDRIDDLSHVNHLVMQVGPVTPPVLPTLPISCPRTTFSPGLTKIWLRCA